MICHDICDVAMAPAEPQSVTQHGYEVYQLHAAVHGARGDKTDGFTASVPVSIIWRQMTALYVPAFGDLDIDHDLSDSGKATGALVPICDICWKVLSQ